MMSNPKVSVLVTVYNLAAYLRETLDCVLAQDYEPLEIVVADDGSTDGSQEILSEYAANYPDKIKALIGNENRGVSVNSNRAFTFCTGELISILDGDDIVLPGKISKQVEMFVKDPEIVLCYHPSEIFESGTNKTLYITNQTPRENTNTAEQIILTGGIAHTSSVMVRRSACPEIGFDERLRDTQDWVFFIEVALKGKIAKVDQILCRYRKHGLGLSDRTLELLEQSLRALDIVLENHPTRKDLFEICQKGKARYIAGEAFRQLSKNISIAKRLAQQAVDLDPKNRRYNLLLIYSSCSTLAGLLRPIIGRFKYLLKKYG